MKGSYILILRLAESRKYKIGKLGTILFKKGYYAYVGSAMNSIEKRILRHLSKNKRFHWHIDYLLKISHIEDIFYKESERKEECDIAAIMQKKFSSIPNFGSSDCSCKSHLFFSTSRERFIEECKRMGMMQFYKDRSDRK